MPAITEGTILVTGANGFVAIFVVRKLLQSGYSVRGTVRSLAKGEHLKKLFVDYGDKFEAVVVSDIATVCSDSSSLIIK